MERERERESIIPTSGSCEHDHLPRSGALTPRSIECASCALRWLWCTDASVCWVCQLRSEMALNSVDAHHSHNTSQASRSLISQSTLP
jgi:hypothetical protein